MVVAARSGALPRGGWAAVRDTSTGASLLVARALPACKWWPSNIQQSSQLFLLPTAAPPSTSHQPPGSQQQPPPPLPPY